MKLILKILVWPFALALSVMTSAAAFLFSRAAVLLGLASAVLSTLVLLVLLAGSAKNAGILAVIAFLISPFGLPRLGALLLGGLMFAGEAIRDFLRG